MPCAFEYFQNIPAKEYVESTASKYTDSTGNVFQVFHDLPPPANNQGAEIKNEKHPKLEHLQVYSNDELEKAEQEKSLLGPDTSIDETLQKFSYLNYTALIEESLKELSS